MLLQSVLVCFSPLLVFSLSATVSAAKPKPVDLKYSCMRVLPVEDQDHRPDDVPLILIHGYTGTKESLRGTFELLALETKKETCIVDLRNHGESPWNNDEYDVEAMTEDIKHLLDRLKARKAIILGQSLGGKIAVHTALTYPERVEKIIVEDMRPNGLTPEAVAEVGRYVKMFKELEKEIPQGVTTIEAKKAILELRNERLRKINPSWVSDDLDSVPIKCSDGKCQWITNTVLLDSFLRDYKEIWSESSGRFDGGALFMYGGKSNFRVGEDETNIRKLFPNAKLVEVPEAGHIVNISKQYTRKVIKFINDKY